MRHRGFDDIDGGPDLARLPPMLGAVETAIAFLILVGVVLHPLVLPGPEETRS
jgi:hypothetical protein